MKETKTTTRPVTKSKPISAVKFKTVEEYIASLPAKSGNITKELRETIQHAAPSAVEWISYNMPTFKIDGKGFIWFAAWKEHISIYPRTAAMEASIKELSDYEGEKGTIKFPLNKPFPFGLVKKIVKFKLSEFRVKPATKLK